MFIQKFYFNIHAIHTSFPQYTMVFRGTHIVVNPELIFKVLRVLRVVHPDYPSHLVSILSLEMSWPHDFMRNPWCGVIFLTSSHMTLLRFQ